MYNFSPTEEQNALIDAARRFANDVLAPGSAAREKAGRIDRDLIREMGSLGLLGVELGEDLGGLGTDCVTAGLVLEQIAPADFSAAYVSVNLSLVCSVVSRFAQPHLARTWVGDLVAGRKIPSIALTEPRGGSDAAHLQVRARLEGDHYILNGEKASISFADQADMTCLFARTGAPDSGAHGVTAFLVPLDLPGITRTAYDDVGTRGVGRGSIFFDNVRIPVDHRLGDENRGFTQVMQGFDYSRALIGMHCLSVAKRSLEEAWEYARDRKAFGKPLTAFQGVTFPLAEAETQLHACRLLVLHALWLKDQGLPHTSEAAMCKWWAPKLSFDVIHACLLTQGHSGYSLDSAHQQRLRDVMGYEIGDGTAQIMKLIIARQKAGRDSVPA